MLDKRSAEPEASGIIRGEEEVLRFVLEALHRLAKTHDVCLDSGGIAVIVAAEQVRKAMQNLHDRGVRTRIITNITPTNVSSCKQAMTFAQIRHLDGVKGNFSVSDGYLYTAAANAKEAQPLEYLFHTSVPAIAEQQQYFFDTLWGKAISAERRIKEIEEGSVRYHTKIIGDPDAILREMRRKNLASKMLSVCATPEGMKMSYQYLWDTYLHILQNQPKDNRSENKAVRWLSFVGRQNAELVKKFLSIGIDVRHVENLPPMSFGLSERELHATIDKMEGGMKVQSLLASTEPAYVEHFRSIFEDLWERGIPAADRLRSLKNGSSVPDIEILRNPREAIERAWKIASMPKKEVLLMFSTTAAFQRQLRSGGLRVLEKAAKSGTKVKILLPADSKIEDMITQLSTQLASVEFRVMDRSLRTRISLLVVDSCECMIFELKDDTKSNSFEAVGLSIYSNSATIVQSYSSIFDNLWMQTELYEQIRDSNQRLAEAYSKLEAHDERQKDFINIAAHELRTPVQPLVNIGESLSARFEHESVTKVKVSREEVEMLKRNIGRLVRLTESILDLSKIESKRMVLNKQDFSLREEIQNVISEMKTDLAGRGARIKFHGREKIIVSADRIRIFEVVSNLLRNAIKFSRGVVDPAMINVSLRTKKGNAIVSVRDYGKGIDPEILPRLFTKFATRSEKGMGLGLYISKSIVEAHSGKMWASNAANGRGATFSFTLPLSVAKEK